MERYRRDPLSWDVPVEFAYRFGVGRRLQFNDGLKKECLFERQGSLVEASPDSPSCSSL